MRLNLAQALMTPSDLLLLDEPTNHLDLDAIIWLEDWLRRYPGTLIVISHDRDFLDGVVKTIVHIDQKKLRRYTGDYSSFEEQRAQQRRSGPASDREADTRARAPAVLHRPLPRQRHQGAPGAEPHEDAGEDGGPRAAARRRAVLLRVPRARALAGSAAGPRGRECWVRRKDRTCRASNLSLRSGERIGLLGVNGAGKSTLVKTIAGTLAAARPATCVLNKGVKVGYFAQHQVEMLRDDESPLWHLKRIADSKVREQDLRDYLGGFNFPGDMATGPVENFSGGEKARLALALIVWQRPNLLLLDEPTNHLDLETREALTVALAQFEGTLVLVSHDRHLLRATTDKLLIVADGTLREFDGDLDDYRDWLLKKAPAPKPEKKVAPAKPRVVKSKPNEQRIKRLEELMARLNAQKASIEQKLADPALYQDQSALSALLSDQAYVAKELEQVEAEWLELAK